MEEFNKLKLVYIPNRPIRDITKVLKRVQFQSLEKNSYKYNNINFLIIWFFIHYLGFIKKILRIKK